ncbi:TIGR02452 family protein [Paraflavitalea pollutisoli]|uniref:TIGR02452 family protein n=1 Tax=Paraflavitalea pollutisoli TaxID=3034143 RepID=UPI0023ECA31E|nr:TIGR02452 family protein [Paraflavitalea sp. H1-2-19X]
MNQKARVAIAEDTLKLLEQEYYVNTTGARVDLQQAMEHATAHTTLYTPEALQTMLDQRPDVGGSFTTTYEVTNETTLDAVRRLAAAGAGNILCLNFASAKNAGGGFLGGAIAQEECIARASGLYPCLLKAPAYYAFHRKQWSCLYSDHMIYSPAVPILKDELGVLLDEIVLTAIVTSPAVNAGVVVEREKENKEQIIPVMRVRTAKLLALCATHGHDTLVLGAWGCGVFRNNPEEIAALFHEALTGPFAGQFRKVVFAVKTNKDSIIEPFMKYFL